MEDPRIAMKDALKVAMKEKDMVTRDVLRMTLNAIKQVEVDDRVELDAAAATAILMKEAKKRREAIDEFRTAGRDDLLEQELAEIAVVERFLPDQMSREEITAIATEVIEQVGATDPKDMGKVMGAMMPRLKGKADGKLVNEVVRDLLKG